MQGLIPDHPIQVQDVDVLTTDRALARRALEAYHTRATGKLTPYLETFIGHTPVAFHKPLQGADVWLMDTGAGWSGVLSMMNVDTKEVFVSDLVPTLYPGVRGRGQ